MGRIKTVVLITLEKPENIGTQQWELRSLWMTCFVDVKRRFQVVQRKVLLANWISKILGANSPRCMGKVFGQDPIVLG